MSDRARTLYLPTPAPAEEFDESQLRAQIALIAGDRTARVRKQHAVSKVILKRFALVSARGGQELYAFNLEYRRGKVRGVSECGKINDLVGVASGSAEQLWQKIEGVLPPVLDDIEADQVLGSESLTTAKHVVGLHFLRSPFYRHRLSDSADSAIREIYRGDARLWRLMARRVYLRTGFYINSHDVLFGEFKSACAEYKILEAGVVGRARLESQLPTVLNAASGMELDVIKVDGNEEFLIGDSPAIAVSTEPPQIGPSVGFLAADHIVLPVSPRRALLLRRPQSNARPSVEEINLLQIRFAYRHVYYRPGSYLAQFVTAHARHWLQARSIELLEWD